MNIFTTPDTVQIKPLLEREVESFYEQVASIYSNNLSAVTSAVHDLYEGTGEQIAARLALIGDNYTTIEAVFEKQLEALEMAQTGSTSEIIAKVTEGKTKLGQYLATQ